MKINLSVERLVLDGIKLDPAQRPIFQEALQEELGRLLAEGGIEGSLAAGGMVPSVRADGFAMSGDGSPVSLGQQIARSVYGGIVR
ncbi:MAG TPA: hypothetical protein VGX68_17955 [Thermoanaerobaculia bacterium]|nr:hypothetical protein [Thermoanaerobaculia bacterium]